MTATDPFSKFLPKLSPHERCLAEAQIATVAPELTEGEWRLIQQQARDEAETALCPDPVLDQEKRKKPSAGTPRSTSTGTHRVHFPEWDEDPLKRIPASVYLPALTGEPVSSAGRTRCPMPDHPDLRPSAKCYGASWRCFSCGAGRSVIDVASALSGIPATGADFWRLRDWIVDALEGAPTGPKEGR
jgi:hypothetical protein